MPAGANNDKVHCHDARCCVFTDRDRLIRYFEYCELHCGSIYHFQGSRLSVFCYGTQPINTLNLIKQHLCSYVYTLTSHWQALKAANKPFASSSAKHFLFSIYSYTFGSQLVTIIRTRFAFVHFYVQL